MTTVNWDHVLELTQEDCFWLPQEGNVIERPELLVLYSSRDIQYLNTVIRVRGTEEELPALVKEVSELHRSVRSRWVLTPGNQSKTLETLLTREGYTAGHRHHGYVMPVKEYQPKFSEHLVWKRVETLQELKDCEEVTLQSFGSATRLSEEELERELVHCTGPDARVLRVVVYDKNSGKAVSSGGMNLYPTLDFGFLWAGSTIPEARQRGAYTTLMSARISLAGEMGLTAVGLYARQGTSAPIVAAQGFLQCGLMVQWDRPVLQSLT
jgi:hypothetical protein